VDGALLAHRLAVVVNDPRPDVETIVRDYIRNNLSTLNELGLPTDNLEKKLSFEADLERSVTGADLVQENGPERIEFKQDLWRASARSWRARTDAFVGLRQDRDRAGAQDVPARAAAGGASLQPPHLIPLVEVVPGEKTSPEAVDDAVRVLRSARQVPRVVRKEMPGFVANRLATGDFRNAANLVIRRRQSR